jgi:hypothetical protein
MSSDILRPLLDEELLVYADHCRKHWPSTIRAHHYLKQQYTWHKLFKKLDETQLNEISDKCKMTFFTPVTSRPEECTFIAISGKKVYILSTHQLIYRKAIIENLYFFRIIQYFITRWKTHHIN